MDTTLDLFSLLSHIVDEADREERSATRLRNWHAAGVVVATILTVTELVAGLFAGGVLGSFPAVAGAAATLVVVTAGTIFQHELLTLGAGLFFGVLAIFMIGGELSGGHGVLMGWVIFALTGIMLGIVGLHKLQLRATPYNA